MITDLEQTLLWYHLLPVPLPRGILNRVRETTDSRKLDPGAGLQLMSFPSRLVVAALGIDWSILGSVDIPGDLSWIFSLMDPFSVKTTVLIHFDTNFLNVLIRNRPQKGQNVGK